MRDAAQSAKDHRATDVLGLLFVLSLPWFATVDELPRCLMVGATLLVTGPMLLRARTRTGPSAVLLAVWGIALLAHLWSLWGFVSAGPTLRSWFQPGMALLLDELLGVAGSTTHALALQPRLALAGFAYGASVLMIAAATALVVTSRTRALRLAVWLLGGGTLVLAIGALHWALGWETPYLSGRGQGAFSFPPFPNGNHAGSTLAALVPLALGVGRADERMRTCYAFVPFLCAGVAVSHARAGLVAMLVGILVLFLMDRSLVARVGALFAAALGALALLYVGPVTVAKWLTEWMEPERFEGLEITSGRFDLWQAGWSLVPMAPVVGFGGGGFEDAYKVVRTSPHFLKMSQAHQEPLQLAVDHGVVSLVGFTVAAVIVLVVGVRALRRKPDDPGTVVLRAYLAAAVTLGLVAFVDFPLRIGAMATLGALLTGVVVGIAPRFGPAPGPLWDRAFRASAALLVSVAAVAVAVLALARPGGTNSLADSTTLWEAGDVDLAAGRPAEALERYKRALGVRPLDQHALLRVAKGQAATGDSAQALATLELACRSHPTWPYAWLNLARARRDSGQTESALAAYERLLHLDPPPGMTWVAWLEETLDLPIDPLTVVLRVVETMPHRRCLAASVVAERNAEAAEMLFWVFIADDPACRPAYAAKLWGWQRPLEALEVLQQAAPGCDRDLIEGQLLVAVERPIDAVVPLERALASCPDKRERVILWLGRARIGAGDARGLSMLEALVSRDPSDDALRHELAAALWSFGRQHEARPHLSLLKERGVATTQEIAWLEGP